MTRTRTVGTLLDSVAGLLQSQNINNTTNLFGALERAARILAQKADCPEASGRENYMFYDGVYDYPAPVTIFGGSLTDLRPQGDDRNRDDYVYKEPVDLFDRTKHYLPNGVAVTFEYDKGTPIMRVSSARVEKSILIDDMSVTTGWAVGGTAGALAADATVYYKNPASLRFNLTGAGTGYIEKTLTNGLDLTDYRGVGVNFLAIRTDDITDLTSIELRLGSDNSNYYALTETSGFLGAFQTGNFLLVAFDLSLAATVGIPTITAMDYVRISFAHTASITNMRVGSLFISLPVPYELLFQSAAIFNVGGVLSNSITDTTDVIILNDAAYTIYEHECAITVALQNGGTFGEGIVASINQILNGIRAPRTGALIQQGLYDFYKAQNPSEVVRTTGSWYD